MAIEPLYSLDVACELIPLTKSALFHILDRKRSSFGVPIYHTYHGQMVGAVSRVRMLRESEVLLVRAMVIKRWDKDKSKRYSDVKRHSKWTRILESAHRDE